MRRYLALAGCALLTLAGCSVTTTGDSIEGAVPVEVDSGPATFSAEPGGPRPEGRFYAIVGGETSNDNRLYELDFSPPELRLLTEIRRVSAVGACGERVVVAAGQPEVGFSDHLQELRGDRLVPLDGLGVQPGFGPKLDGRCRAAYTWVDRGSPAYDHELRVWDLESRTGRTLYRSQPGDGPLVSAGWGPEGQVATVRIDPQHGSAPPEGTPPGRPPAVIIVAPGGEVTEIGLEGDPGVQTWGARWLAIMDDAEGVEGTIFIDPAEGTRFFLPGWYPLSWSPGGDRLLVKDAESRRILGLVEPADLSSVAVLGRVSGPVHDLDWLPA